MFGTIRAFALVLLVLLPAFRGPAALASPSDETAWRDIQLRRRAIDSLHASASTVEAKALAKLSKELVRKKFAASQRAELERLLGNTLSAEQIASLVSAAAASAAGCSALEGVVAKWRVASAKALFSVSKKAAKAGFAGSAARFATRTIEFDPDSKQARAYLGFKRLEGAWLPAWRAELESSGQVFDPRCGWGSRSDLGKLNSGLLPLRGKWLPSADVTLARTKWANRWSLRWGRWRVETDVSIEVAVQLAQLLEETDRFARHEFGDRFDVQSSSEIVVLIFRNQAEFELEIEERHPQSRSLKTAAGFYSDEDMAVHAFWRVDTPLANIRLIIHEATHALVSETAGPGDSALRSGPGDALEEVHAMAMEALSVRGRAARSSQEPGVEENLQSLLRGARRVSLAEFFGRHFAGGEFLDADQVYDHAYALARFCGGCVGGEVFVWQLEEYLWHLRHHGPNPDLFAKMMGKSWPELEKDWSAFLDKLAAEGAPKKK